MKLTHAVHLDTTETIQCINSRVRAVRFKRLFGLGAFSLLVPALLQTFAGISVTITRSVPLAMVLVYCLHILYSQRAFDFRRIPRLALVVNLLLLGRPFSEIIHGTFSLSSFITTLSTFIIIWTLWSLRPSLREFDLVAIVGVVIALVSLAMILISPEVAFMTTDSGALLGAHKLDSQRGLLSGPFPNSNTLGILLATSVPFVFLWERKLLRVIMLIPILLALWMTVARTSIAATVVVLVVFFLTVTVFSSSHSKKILLATTIMTVTLVQITLPFIVSDPEFLSGRGKIWIVDSAAWGRHPWLGNGELWFTNNLIQSGIINVEHVNSHNTVLDWLTFGGLFYFIIGSAYLFLLIRASWFHMKAGNSVPIGFTLVLLIVGISESHWHFFATSPLFFMQGVLMAGIVFSIEPYSISRVHKHKSQGPRDVRIKART